MKIIMMAILRIKAWMLVFNYLCFMQSLSAQTKFLFDASKAEMAGNADWVIDADAHNLGTGNGGAMVIGQGTEANPQRFPSPLQSTINSSTDETYWEGSLSSWGVALVNLGYEVETLTNGDSITYGNGDHAQDLSNYEVFIVDEPNIRFTLAERNAILNFVLNGGGLFMISDHNSSDRNNDGWDSPHIWNDMSTTNTIQNDPFGISFDYKDFSETSTNFNSLSEDSILHGPEGDPSQMQFSDGTSMTLNSSHNSSVTGIIFKSGSSHASTNVMMAHCYYGHGRVAALGDSSPADDGTGDPNDDLYNGWSAEANGDHARILLNASIWLAGGGNISGIASFYQKNDLDISPNPASSYLSISKLIKTCSSVSVTNEFGRILKSVGASSDVKTSIDLSDLVPGIYFLEAIEGNSITVKKFVKM